MCAGVVIILVEQGAEQLWGLDCLTVCLYNKTLVDYGVDYGRRGVAHDFVHTLRTASYTRTGSYCGIQILT